MGSRNRDEDGAISIMVAVLTVALLMAGSLAIDVGRMAYVSRDQQGATDRAALDASWVLDDLDGSETLADVHAAVRAAAVDSLGVNPASATSTGRQLTNVEIGFVANDAFFVMWDDNGAGPYAFQPEAPTAVRVTTDSFVSFVLALNDAQGGRDIEKVAVVDRAPTASISIGTRLVDYDTNRALYAGVVQRLIGGSAGLSLVGFDGLAHIWLSPEVFGGASVAAGTAEDLLDVEVALVDMIDAMIAEIQAGFPDLTQTVPDSAPGILDPSDATYGEVITALQEIRAAADPALTFTMAQVMRVAGADLAAFRDGQVNALDTLVHGMVASQSGNLISLSFSGPDALGMAGVESLDIDLNIIESAQTATGAARYVPANDLDNDGLIEEGEEAFWVTTAETSQIDLTFDFVMNSFYSDELLGPLFGAIPLVPTGTPLDDIDPSSDLPSLCGLGVLLCEDLALHADVQAAQGEAWLTSITCPSDADPDGHATTDFESEALVLSLNTVNYTQVAAREHDITDKTTPQYPSELTRVTNLALAQLDANYPDEIPEQIPEPDWYSFPVVPDTVPLFDQSIDAILGMLGLDLGHAVVGWNGVDCSNRQLQPLHVGQ